VGDIGLIACKVQETEDSEQIEGYHVLVGGGFGPDAGLAREIHRDVKAADVPPIVERLLKAYLARRASQDETFLAFMRRHDDAAIKQMADGELVS
jgi:ferredoxin-nitrite reductase